VTLTQHWLEFFHGEAPGATLALFRIAFGLVVVTWMCARLPYAELLYGRRGYGAGEQVMGGVVLLSYAGALPRAATLTLVTGAVAACCVSVGLLLPVAAFVVFLCTATLAAQLPFVRASWEFVIALLSLLLVATPASQLASADALLWPDRIARWGGSWAVRLMQLQLCLIYVLTASRKLLRGWRVWLSGAPVYNLHHGPQGRFFIGWIRWPLVYRLLAWFALAVELSFPVLVWWPSTRYPALVAVALLHLGMDLFLRIFPFQWVMLAALTLFLADADARWVLQIIGLL
jgi:hypothetical protein